MPRLVGGTRAINIGSLGAVMQAAASAAGAMNTSFAGFQESDTIKGAVRAAGEKGADKAMHGSNDKGSTGGGSSGGDTGSPGGSSGGTRISGHGVGHGQIPS